MINEFYSGSHTETQLTAAAYRAADSILRSTKYLLPSIGQELLALLTLDTLWGLCLLAAGWFLVSVISGPLGLAVNVVLLGYGVYSAWGTIEQTYEQFKDWFWGSILLATRRTSTRQPSTLLTESQRAECSRCSFC